MKLVVFSLVESCSLLFSAKGAMGPAFNQHTDANILSSSVECIISPSRALNHLIQDNDFMAITLTTLSSNHSIKVQ